MTERVALSPSAFVTAAVRFTEQHGFEALTMRSLATEMGISPTAVYRHFPDRDHLVAALADELISRAATPDPSLPPRQRIEAMMRASRETIRAHPRLSHVVSVTVDDVPRANAFSIALIADLEDLGLGGDDLILGYRFLEGLIGGSSIFDHSGAPDHLAQRRRRYRTFNHPVFDQHTRTDTAMDALNERAYEEAVRVILDDLERRVANTRADSDRTTRHHP